MFKPHFGLCKCHNKNRLIVVKSGLCQQGNTEKKNLKRAEVRLRTPAHIEPVKKTYKKETAEDRLFKRRKAAIKKRLIEERGYVYCERCETSNCSWWQVHHIAYRSEFPSHPQIHCFENLVHLCSRCHDFFHEKKSNRNKLVRERKLNLIFDNSVLNK